MLNKIRWTGRTVAMIFAFAALANVGTTWVWVGDVPIDGGSFEHLGSGTSAPLHPLVHFYRYTAVLLLLMALLLATAIGVCGRRARFVAGGVALFASVMSWVGSVGVLMEIEPYWEPWEVRRVQVCAGIMAVLGVVIMAAAVGLMFRKFPAFDAVATLILAAVGVYHLVAIGVLYMQRGSGLTVTGTAWLSGPAVLLAAGAAAVAATCAALLRQWRPPIRP